MGRMVVTGAAGFIGSHLVERLLSGGHEVVGVDAFTNLYSRERKERNLAPAMRCASFRLVEGDVSRLALDALLDGADAVFHLAGEPGVRQSWGGGFGKYLERNVLATERLLEAATGVSRFVYASSSSVYGPDPGFPVGEGHPRRPASPYGVSKLAAEEMVSLHAREKGVPATVLRYFTVYGPRQRPEMAVSKFISAALEGRPVVVFGDGSQIRDMTYVSDAVEATVAVLEGGADGVYNVGGGTRASVSEMVEAVRSVTGMGVEVVHGNQAKGDVSSTWADSGRAARELGYRPRVGLREGISAQVEWVAGESLAAATV